MTNLCASLHSLFSGHADCRDLSLSLRPMLLALGLVLLTTAARAEAPAEQKASTIIRDCHLSTDSREDWARLPSQHLKADSKNPILYGQVERLVIGYKNLTKSTSRTALLAVRGSRGGYHFLLEVVSRTKSAGTEALAFPHTSAIDQDWASGKRPYLAISTLCLRELDSAGAVAEAMTDWWPEARNNILDFHRWR
jgi:hypothetical protein